MTDGAARHAGHHRRARPDGADRPHPVRFPPEHPHYDEAMAAHTAAVAAGHAGYLDPATGLFAMTGAHLLARGWCCDRGCRHCPWVGGPKDADAISDDRDGTLPATDDPATDEETT